MGIIFNLIMCAFEMFIFGSGVYTIMRWIYLHNSMASGIWWMFIFVTAVIVLCLMSYAKYTER